MGRGMPAGGGRPGWQAVDVLAEEVRAVLGHVRAARPDQDAAVLIDGEALAPR